jgi:hypothetical protein
LEAAPNIVQGCPGRDFGILSNAVHIGGDQPFEAHMEWSWLLPFLGVYALVLQGNPDDDDPFLDGGLVI